MNEQAQEALLEILQVGLLRIRAAGGSGLVKQCAIEADHLHNLPLAIQIRSPDLLRYYWDAERPGFIAWCDAQNVRTQCFGPAWEKLLANLK
jgi:hypothetical protein